MAFPPGITTATITAGPVVDMRGEPAQLTADVTTVLGGPSHITHAGTGTVIAASIPFTVASSQLGTVSFTVPHVDTTGWVDPTGAVYNGWKYVVRLTAKFGGKRAVSWTKEVQPVAGQPGPIDLDLVPGGAQGVPQSAPVPYVLSINGQTDHVRVDTIPPGGALGQVLARGEGGLPVWANPKEGQSDHGVLTGLGDDDHPQYALADGSRGEFAAKAHAHTWDSIPDKPLFFAPEHHTHTWSSVTNKPATFPPSGHAHAQADISGLSGALAGKADVARAIPAGGAAGQVLAKSSSSDYATTWVNPSVSGGGTGTGMLREVLAGENLNAALSGYEGLVVLQRGVHYTSVPIIQNRRQKVVGEGGGATTVRATAAMDALWKAGNGAPADRMHLSDICLDADKKANIGLDYNVVGTTGNTNGEPDGQAHFERLYIDDALVNGVVTRGGDSQAYHFYGVRVRRAGDYGFRIEGGGPDAWFTDCEATTSNDGGAGFYVNSANLHFKGCKAWYTRGYGYHIRGTRNMFVDCEAQDTKLHGWMIDWDMNTFVGCWADSAGYGDVGGVHNTQDGFYLATGLKHTAMVGCQAFDREQGYPAQQRYGFNMSASTYNIGRGDTGTAPAGVDTVRPPAITGLNGGLPTTSNFKNVSGLLNLR